MDGGGGVSVLVAMLVHMFDSGGGVGAGVPGGGDLGVLGPVELAGVLAPVDPGVLPDGLLLEHARAWERVISWATAGQCAVLGEFAHRRMERVGDQVRSGRQEQVGEFAVDEVALALHCSRPAASRRVELAVALQDLPATSAALGAGVIDGARARVVAETVVGLPAHQCRAVEAAVLPGAGEQTPGQLRVALARAVIATDPAAADRRHAAARARRRCELFPLPDGMALLRATLPGPEALTAWAVLDSRARQGGAGRGATMDQRRADALLDLLTRPPGGDPSGPTPQIRLAPAGIRVTISASTLAGCGEDPGYLSGYGYLPPELTRQICRTITPGGNHPGGTPGGGTPSGGPGGAPGGGPGGGGGPAPGGGARPGRGPRPAPARTGATLLVTDAVRGSLQALLTPTGRLLDATASAPSYTPPPALAELIYARDLTCRFPGCRHPARRCDIDHVVPHPRGPTAAGNLVALCRRHHRLKHSPGWSLRIHPSGLEWTSPTGHTYQVAHAQIDPATPLPPDPTLPPPPEQDPDPDHDWDEDEDEDRDGEEAWADEDWAGWAGDGRADEAGWVGDGWAGWAGEDGWAGDGRVDPAHHGAHDDELTATATPPDDGNR